MKISTAVVLAGVMIFSQVSHLSSQGQVAKLFLLEDAGSNQWCAYSKEASWNTAVQDIGAMTVGVLTYSNGRLSQIDLTETDESGDWTIYDHYFLNSHGEIIKLSRMINVLPGDRSVLQTFSISDGKARKTATTEKQLSTGKQLTSAKPVWLPDLPIKMEAKLFPFSGLLGLPGLTMSNKSCIQTSGHQK